MSCIERNSHGGRHTTAVEQNLCRLLRSACLHTTVSPCIGILTLQLPIPILLPTQLTFIMRTLQLSLIKDYLSRAIATHIPKAKLAGRKINLYKNLTHDCMQPAAIALNYSVKDIQNDV